MSHGSDLVVFALGASQDLGRSVASKLGIELAPVEERAFEDGEHKTRPLASVRGQDVFVISSLYGDGRQSVNDKLCRLLFFLGAVADAAAARVTAVMPYLCYARKDRKTKSRDPITTRYVAALLEAMGAHHIVTLDVHNLAAYQNAFRRPTENLEARKLFASHFASLALREDAVIVSADVGGVKRAAAFGLTLSRLVGRPLPLAFMEKSRSEGIVSSGALVGDVRGRTAIVLDDMISTGTTLLQAARACRELGARAVHAAATHGLFVGDASRVLTDPSLDDTVVTNAIPPLRLNDAARRRLTVLDVAPLFAEAIRRLHEGGSIVEMLEP